MSCAIMLQPTYLLDQYGNQQLFYRNPVNGQLFHPQQHVRCVPVAPAPVPVPDSGYCSDSASSSSSRDVSPTRTSSSASSVSSAAFQSNSTRRYERDMDLDAMTRRNGGTLMHSAYLKQMNDLCRENIATGSFTRDPTLLRLNSIRNKYLDEDALELHGLPRKLATDVLKKRVDEINRGLRPSTLYVCAGQGKHSATGEPVIKNDVIRNASNFGYSCREMRGNRGVLVLTFH